MQTNTYTQGLATAANLEEMESAETNQPNGHCSKTLLEVQMSNSVKQK